MTNPAIQNKTKKIHLNFVGSGYLNFEGLKQKVKKNNLGIFQTTSTIKSAIENLTLENNHILIIPLKDRNELAHFIKLIQNDFLNYDKNKIIFFLILNFSLENKNDYLNKLPFVLFIESGLSIDKLYEIIKLQVNKFTFKSDLKKGLTTENQPSLMLFKSSTNSKTDISKQTTQSSQKQLIFNIDQKKIKEHKITQESTNKSKNSIVILSKPSEKSQNKNESLIKIENKNDRNDILTECFEEQKNHQLYGAELNWKVKTHVNNYDLNTNILSYNKIKQTGIEKIKEQLKSQDKNFFSSASLRRARVLFSLKLSQITPNNELLFKIPEDKVYRIQRRKHFRLKVFPDFLIYADLFTPSSVKKNTLRVYDVSIQGLSILVNEKTDRNILKYDQFKNSHLLIANRKIEIPEMQLKHITPLDGSKDKTIVGFELKNLSPMDSSFLEFFVFSKSIDYLSRITFL